MVSMSVIKLSSKGQIVIPASMRENLKAGDELLLIKDDERILLKKVDNLTKEMKDDLEFARRTEEALKRYDKGEFISMSGEDFLKELEKW